MVHSARAWCQINRAGMLLLKEISDANEWVKVMASKSFYN